MNEFELIDKLAQRFAKPSPSVELGIGDDAAVVASGGGLRWAVTADALVEGVHFDRRFGTTRQLGRKALAVNLSDLAAMGADPRFALVTLTLPETTPESFVDELSPRNAELELRMEILKHIILVKKTENAAKLNRAKRQAEVAKLQGILEQKQDAALEELSAEQLEAKIKELRGLGL